MPYTHTGTMPWDDNIEDYKLYKKTCVKRKTVAYVIISKGE